jgi:thermostable 8-oxoguanine DNA glycosylase
MKDNWSFRGEVGKLNKTQYLDNEKEFFGLAEKLEMKPEELDIAIWMLGNRSGNFYG